MAVNSSSSGGGGGVGFIGLLQVVFIVLKLIGVIDWSWAVVLIPIWIDFGYIIASIVIISRLTSK